MLFIPKHMPHWHTLALAIVSRSGQDNLELLNPKHKFNFKKLSLVTLISSFTSFFLGDGRCKVIAAEMICCLLYHGQYFLQSQEWLTCLKL